jgi:hypothetical protein
MTQTLIIHVIRTKNSLPSELSQPVADHHNLIHHGFWDVVAVFPHSLGTGLHALAAAVLANPDAHAALLPGPYPDHQSVVAGKAMDLNRHFRRHGGIRQYPKAGISKAA